jgi:hydroxymethylpyrimidine/phosphomethylpyrimidine kinase
MVPIALSIAGSDPSGGAGIQADLKTFSALGVYGAAVLAALTAQNTRGVTGVQAVPPTFVRAQMDAVFDDLAVGAVKTGMLADAPLVEAVAGGLAGRAMPVVVDPVMIATSGDRLLAPDAVEAVRRRLLPLARVVTPNLPEAAALLDTTEATDEAAMAAQARAILAFGPSAVLLKGGHGHSSEAVDLLVDAEGVHRFAAPRIATRNTHGTGCTLSSAIAAGLARGLALTQAVAAAKTYVTGAIAAADTLGVGHGHGPVHHFHALWPPAAANRTGGRS